jgi:hypothetical protein
MSERNKEGSGNNWEKLGKVTQWFNDLELNTEAFVDIGTVEQRVYLYLVRSCIGYGQYETKRISIKELQLKIKKSNKPIILAIKRLQDANLIDRVKSNKSDKTFKQAYKYRLVFRRDLDFPYLGKLEGRSSVEEKEFQEYMELKKNKNLMDKF